MRKFRQCSADFLKTFDVFNSPVSLRYDKQPTYDTISGGCISLAMIILLISVFFNQWIDIFSYKVIYANQQTVREFDPSKLLCDTNQFMFALGVIGIDLNSNESRYFDLNIQTIWRDQNKTYHQEYLPLEPCTVDQWKKYGDQFEATFNRMELNKFKCPPSNQSWHFEGKYTSQNFAYIKITFKRCTGIGCKTESQFNKYIASRKAFYFDVFYTNTLLNKDQLKPIHNVFQDKTYLLVSDTLGVDMNIYISEYSMVTDYSLWPWEEQQTNKGLIIDKGDHQQWSYVPNDDTMCKVYFRKSDNEINIQRSFRKVDDMLSYIGGLFGLIAVAFGVFMSYYSQCSYELQLSSGIFQYRFDQDKNEQETKKPENNILNGIMNLDTIKEEDAERSNEGQKDKKTFKRQKAKRKKTDQEKQLDPSDFNLWDYIQYIFYLCLKKIGCKPKWKKIVMYDDTLNQMRNQMNINNLLQKITFFDKAIHTLFDDQQLKLLYLQEKYNIIQIKKQRELLNMGLQILNQFGFKQTENSDINIQCNLNMPSNILNCSHISGLQFVDQQRKKTFDYQKGQLRDISNQNSVVRSNIGRSALKFIKRSEISPLDAMPNKLDQDSRQGSDIHQEVKQALDYLQVKISEGDMVSLRIYQGLDPILIEKYQQKRNGDSKKRNRKKRITRLQDQLKPLEKRSILRFQNR